MYYFVACKLKCLRIHNIQLCRFLYTFADEVEEADTGVIDNASITPGGEIHVN